MNHHFLNSRTFKIVVGCVALVILLVVTFRVGVSVGYRRALFTMHWSNNYEHNFFDPRESTHAHGPIGTIIKTAKNSIVVSDRDGVEKPVVFSSETIFRRGVETLQASDLAIGDTVAVLGSPNDDGQIEAKLIRVLSNKQ